MDKDLRCHLQVSKLAFFGLAQKKYCNFGVLIRLGLQSVQRVHKQHSRRRFEPHRRTTFTEGPT